MRAMIIGGRAILYSQNAGADRAFLRDVLQPTHVEVGRGWLIFGRGMLTEVTLPGGRKLGVYQPRPARPAAMA